MNPGSRPRRGVLAIGAVAAVVAAVVGLVIVGGSEEAQAAELRQFTSCAELSDWATASQEATARYGGSAVFDTTGAEVAEDAAVSTTMASADSPLQGGGASGDGDTSRTSTGTGESGVKADDGTNVVVEGVDELDLVDRLGDGRVLVASASHLALVDLESATVLATVPVPGDAQITHDREAGVVWVVGAGEQGGVLVQRVAVGGGTLAPEGEWSTSGTLVDARRVGDWLHLVASEGFTGVEVREGDSLAGGTDVTEAAGEAAVPFTGGPVPCDQVYHPVGSSDPVATLLVTLPVEGALEPLDAAEVTGAGQFVHVTTESAYLATPIWADQVVTTIHRFDLATLTPTGSGRVSGQLLDEFSMSEHDGHLRVAVTAGTPGGVGRPVPVDDVIVTADVEGPTADDSVSSDARPEPTVPGSTTSVPASTVPQITTPPTTVPGTTVPPTTVPGNTVPGTTVPPTTVPGTTVPGTTVPPTTVPGTTVPGPTEPEPEPVPGEPLNQVVVVDTDGDLDVVGRTPRFGHAGETLHGIRFDGTVAYAVTFLTTDPFYVLDLTDPTAPKVAGEVELPGFSAYLHPLPGGLVVGFGPDGQGRASAKLFDVSDRTQPRLVDSVVLGDESPVASDHHAFVDLHDGRFAVPASSWRATFPDRCTPEIQAQAQAEARRIEESLATQDPRAGVSEDADGLYRQLDELNAGGCLYPGSVTDSAVVTLAVDGRRLVERDRVTTELPEPASRAIPAPDGWALLTTGELTVLDGAGEVRTTLSLG